MEKKARMSKTKRKEMFLVALDKRLLNVTDACKAIGIPRSLVYLWKDNDPKFAAAWKEVEESFFDKLETTMFAKALTEQDNTMLIWLSKTKMKNRGYVERVENDVSFNAFEQLMQDLPDEE